MKAKDFKLRFLPFAEVTAIKTGIDPYVILAQSALETGWGEHAPGNMMFGVKDFDGINGNEQLITTFEFSRRFGLTPAQIGLHEIHDVSPSVTNPGFYKYTGTAYFRKYNTPEESFTDHARVFAKNPRYKEALAHRYDPETFVRLMAPIYAQSPTYASSVLSIMKTLKAI